MKTFLISLVCSILGYLIVAISSFFLVGWLSTNRHDRGVEASMTSVFVWGPIGLVIGLVAGYFWAKSN